MTLSNSCHAVLSVPLALLLACGSDDNQGPSQPVDGGTAPAAGCAEGGITASGALYRTCFPATWNGEVVLYAHGYVSSTEPLRLPDDALGGVSLPPSSTASAMATPPPAIAPTGWS